MKRNYSLEDNVSYFISAGPAEQAIKYLEKLVAHAEAGGEVDWKSAMNSHDPEHTSLEYAKRRLEMLKGDSGVGLTREGAKIKITKAQLRQIIKEEFSKLTEAEKEPYYAEEGDFLLISVSDDGYDVGVEVHDTKESALAAGGGDQFYKSYSRSLYCVAQIVQVAGRDPEDY